MTRHESEAALSVWAVTCDALARGEQIFLLAPGTAREMSGLEHRRFWLVPDWEGQRVKALTEPYQDRLRALDDLRHQDDRARLKFFATVEYLEPVGSPHDLRGLDGEHTLRAGAVRGLFDGAAAAGGGEASAPGGISLVVLRVHARPEAAVVGRADLVPAGTEAAAGGDLPGPLAGRWLRLPEPVSTEDMDPVVGDERFLSLKAHILQRTGAIRAV